MEQRNHHLVVGKKDGARLEYLDLVAHGAHKNVLYSRAHDVDSVSLALKNNPEMLSSDGRWKGHCDVNLECTLHQTADPRESFTVSALDIATPLYWSPRGNLILFARKCGRVQMPPTEISSPEWVAIVYDPRTRREAAVATFGGEDPYDGLRWYQLALGE